MSAYKPKKPYRLQDTQHKVRDKSSSPYDASGGLLNGKQTRTQVPDGVIRVTNSSTGESHVKIDGEWIKEDNK